MSKPAIRAALASALASVLATAALPALAQDVTLKFHHLWTPQAMAPINVAQRLMFARADRLCVVLGPGDGERDVGVPEQDTVGAQH